MASLFTVDHVGFSYRTEGDQEFKALTDISLEINAGEFISIIGANGSGKTTLARLLGALSVPSQGTISIDGIDTKDKSSWTKLHQRVGMVFQNPEDQVIANIVEEDVAFGLENMGLPADEILRRTQAALEEVGLWDQRQRPPHLLSAGQIQKLALADVIAMRPWGVIFDEVTTMIDPLGRKMIMETMKRMLAQGITVIFITHFMEEAAQADRILLMKQGRLIKDARPAEVFSDVELIRSAGLELPLPTALARELHQTLPDFSEKVFSVDGLLAEVMRHKSKFNLKAPPNSLLTQSGALKTKPAIEISGLDFIYLKDTPLARQALWDVSMQVGERSCHGLAGITGSGKSTLLQHMNGLLRPQTGKVRAGPFDLNDPKVKLNSVIQYVGLVFQNPETQFFEQFVGDEIAFGPKQIQIKESLAERVRWAMELVGLDFEGFKDRLVYSLSGGEKRKVALASTLALRPSILLLDEPTAGLDPQSRREILAGLKQLKESGMTLVLSSHQMEVLGEMGDILTLLNKGRSSFSGSPAEVFYLRDTLLENGLEPPLIPQIVMGLQQQGLPLPDGILSSRQLLDALRNAGEQ